jgi:hypothetical protein
MDWWKHPGSGAGAAIGFIFETSRERLA